MWKLSRPRTWPLFENHVCKFSGQLILKWQAVQLILICFFSGFNCRASHWRETRTGNGSCWMDELPSNEEAHHILDIIKESAVRVNGNYLIPGNKMLKQSWSGLKKVAALRTKRLIYPSDFVSWCNQNYPDRWMGEKNRLLERQSRNVDGEGNRFAYNLLRNRFAS